MNQAAQAQESTLPFDREAEQAVLGCVLQNNAALPQASALLTPDSFFSPAHRDIFRAMQELVTRGDPVDELTLRAHLAAHKQLEGVGGVMYLAELVEATPLTANVMAYAEMVADCHARREMVSLAEHTDRAARDRAADAFTLASEIEERVRGLTLKRGALALQSALQLSGAVMAIAETPREAMPPAVHTHTWMDHYLGGFTPGFISVIGARTGNGKTAFLCHMAHENAVRGVPGLIVSMEMRNWAIFTRIVCKHAQVPGTRPLRRQFDRMKPQERDAFAEGTIAVGALPLFFTGDGRELSLEYIRYQARQAVLEHGVRWVGVDHIKKIKPPTRGAPLYEAQSQRALGLSEIAKELDVPFVVLAQINREGEDEPRLIDIEGSDVIAQESDAVLLMQANPKPDLERRFTVKVWLKKQRNARPTENHIALEWWPWIYTYQQNTAQEELSI